jgi:hypothetical protein
MDFFITFSRFIIFIVEGFRFGLNLYFCVGVVPFISMVGSAAATAMAAAAAAAKIPAAGRTSSAAALFMAVVLSALLCCVEDFVDLLLGEQFFPGLLRPVHVEDATIFGVVSFAIFVVLIAHFAVPLGLLKRVITITVVAVAAAAVIAVIVRGIVFGGGGSCPSTSPKTL